MNKNLYSVPILEGNSQEIYAVIAKDFPQAYKAAIQQASNDRCEELPEGVLPTVVTDLAFEITVASDLDGNLYEIMLCKKGEPNEKISAIKALRQLASAYENLSKVWDDSWEGPDNFGGELEDLGLLPRTQLDEAAATLMDIVEGGSVAQEVADSEGENNVEIAQTLVLSTAHVTKEICFGLSQKEYEQSLIVYDKGKYGYWIHVPESIAEGLPACLQEIFKLAYEVNAQWVMLDCDGPLNADLPQYNW